MRRLATLSKNTVVAIFGLCATDAAASPLADLAEQVYAGCNLARQSGQNTGPATLTEAGFERGETAVTDFAEWSAREGAAMFGAAWVTPEQKESIARLANLTVGSTGATENFIVTITGHPGGTLAIYPDASNDTLTCTARIFDWAELAQLQETLSQFPGQNSGSGPRQLARSLTVSGLYLLGDAADPIGTLKIESMNPPAVDDDDRPITSITFELPHD